MVHAALLGSSREFPVIMGEDGPALNWQKKAARQSRDAALARGEFPVLQHEQEETTAITDVLKAQLDERGLFGEKGQFEYTVMWQADTHYGPIWCRARLDHWEERDGYLYVSDLKTDRDASDDGCERAVRSYGYHIQEAAYTEAITMAMPQYGGRVRFRFVFAELQPVPTIRIVVLDAGYKKVGRRLWNKAKNTWGRCLAVNDWPGYPLETTLEAPDWYLAQHGGF